MTRARDTANVVPLTSADLWRLTTDIVGTNADITANLERADDGTAGFVGGMSQASGIFTFPSTGVWLVQVTAGMALDAGDEATVSIIATANNGGAWDNVALATAGNGASSKARSVASACALIDVTNTAQVKVKFATVNFAAGSDLKGNTDANDTHFLFLRVGNT